MHQLLSPDPSFGRIPVDFDTSLNNSQKLWSVAIFFFPDRFLDSSLQKSLETVAGIVFNQNVTSQLDHFLQYFKLIGSQSYMHGSVTV